MIKNQGKKRGGYIHNNILILGGAGFIGSNLTEFFVKNNKKVVVFDKKNATWGNLKGVKNKIKIIKGDFNNSNTLKKIFGENKIDIVIHSISSATPSTQLDDIIKNKELISTIKLINIMMENKVNKIIYFSSGGTVYGMNNEKINREASLTKPIIFYGWLKVTIENYIQMCGRVHKLNYLILRASNPYGKNQNIYGNQGLIAVTLGKLFYNKPIEIWGDGKVIRDYIYIDDVCKATFMLIKKNKWNNIYNIGSGKGSNINEILQIIKNITNIDFNIDYKKNRKIDIPVNILDVSKIKKDVNWKSLTSLEKGVKITWENLLNKLNK